MFRRPAPPPPSVARTVCLCANTTWYVVNFRGRLIRALIASGTQVVVVSPTDRYVDRLRALGATHVALSLDNAGTNPLAELAAIVRLVRTLSRIAPTDVLTWTPKINIYGSLAGRLLRIPVVANVSGLGRAEIAGAWLATVTHALYRVALRWPRLVFFQNRDDLRRFVDRGVVRPDRARRLPGSGVDVARFTPVRTSADGTVRFVLVARMMWDKGVGEFVEAARIVRARCPEARFALVGFCDVDNPSAVQRDTLDTWSREGVVEYLGAFDDMVPVYAAADCVVLPSYREGMPRALLEAAAMAKPTITCDVEGCREAVVDGVTGWIVAVRDAVALSRAMLEFVATPQERREAIGAAARARVEAEFDERRVIDAYLDALELNAAPRAPFATTSRHDARPAPDR
jgi:glycosyltransferase involved in cell wall biosynthesis